MDTKKAKKAIRVVAVRHGVTEAEVIREIEAALVMAGKGEMGLSACEWVANLAAQVQRTGYRKNPHSLL